MLPFLRALVVVAVTASLCFAGIVMFGGAADRSKSAAPVDRPADRSDSGSATEPVEPGRDRAVEGLLMRLRRTKDPKRRSSIIRNSGLADDRIERGLAAILAQPDHRLLADAIVVTGATGSIRLAEPVRQLMSSASSAGTLPLVLKTYDKLQSWGHSELVGLLAHEESAVVITAMTIAAKREDPPWTELLELATHEDAEIRNALVAAIPFHLEFDQLKGLCERASTGNTTARECALRALGRVPRYEEVETVLVDGLSCVEPAMRQAAFDALMQNSAPLAEPGRLWALIRDEAAPLRERARLIACLERTRSLDGIETLRGDFDAHPVFRYFGARCLIVAGHPGGVDMITDLLGISAQDLQGVDRDLTVEIRRGTRRILAELSGLKADSAASEFGVWREAGESIDSRALSPPMVWSWTDL